MPRALQTVRAESHTKRPAARNGYGDRSVEQTPLIDLHPKKQLATAQILVIGDTRRHARQIAGMLRNHSGKVTALSVFSPLPRPEPDIVLFACPRSLARPAETGLHDLRSGWGCPTVVCASKNPHKIRANLQKALDESHFGER